MLKAELYRAFHNKRFIFAVMVGVLLATLEFATYSYGLVETVLEVQKGSDAGIAYMQQASAGVNIFSAWMGLRGSKYQPLFFYILPLLCVLPHAVSYCSDIKTGYANLMITRCGRKKYYISKYIAVFLSAGVVAVLPFIYSLMLCMSFIPITEVVWPTRSFAVFAHGFLADVFVTHPFMYAFAYMAFDFILFGLLACTALTVSCMDDNRFVTAVAPFILYYTMHTFCTWVLGEPELSPQRYACFTYFQDSAKWAVLKQMAALWALGFPFLTRIFYDKDVVQ